MKKSNNSSTHRPVLRVANIVLAIGAVVILFSLFRLAWYYLGPPSPERVRDQALRAFETRDWYTLVKLTDPEEFKTLNFTPDTMRTLLNETIWSEETGKVTRMFLWANKPVDRRVWLVNFEKDKGPGYSFGITVVDDPKVGWKLVLSDTMYLAYRRSYKAGHINYDIHDRWQTLGITGIRNQSGIYEYFKDGI
ncbi:MAG: hypothetical protein OHK0029_28180 [Armatimonadaceae bacterium]